MIRQKSKKLYRSRKNRIIAGVAGGLGEYFGIDPTVIRLLFILLIFTGGGGILFYLALWLFMPLQKSATKKTEETVRENLNEMKEKFNNVVSQAKVLPERNEKNYWGILLVFFGLLLLLNNYTFLHFWTDNLIWPFILVVIGFIILMKRK